MKKRLTLLACLLATAGLIFGASWGPLVASAVVPGINELIHTDSLGVIANSGATTGTYVGPRISGDGKYVAFASNATNLVANDTNGHSDVFLKNVGTGQVNLISLRANGSQWAFDSVVQDLSYDGRYVLHSVGTANGLYVRDTQSNTTTKVCETSLGCPSGGGSQGGKITADGRYVVWEAVLSGSANNQIVLTNMQTLHSRTISVDSSGNQGNGRSYLGDISCDGGIMSFYTQATNLPSGSGAYLTRFDENGNLQPERVSNITAKNSNMSCNGNVIAWYTITNPSSVQVYNRITGQILLSMSGGIHPIPGVGVSDDGRYVTITTQQALDPSYQLPALAGGQDVYIRDFKNNTTQLVTFTTSNARSGSVDQYADISGDGSKVVYSYPTPPNTNPARELISGVNTGTSSYRLDIYTSETGF